MKKERKLIIAGNWKMNKTVAEALTLVADLKRDLANIKDCLLYTSHLTYETPVSARAFRT